MHIHTKLVVSKARARSGPLALRFLHGIFQLVAARGRPNLLEMGFGASPLCR